MVSIKKNHCLHSEPRDSFHVYKVEEEVLASKSVFPITQSTEIFKYKD